MKVTPFEYCEGKLGVKMSFLISDRNAQPESLNLIKYRTLRARMDSDTCIEKQLRRASLNYDALLLFSSLCQEWKDRLTIKFGSPQAEAKKSWFSDHYEYDVKAFDFYSAYRYGEDDKRLDPAFIERYTYNASMLNTVIRLKANRKAYAKALGCTSIDIWESLAKDVNAFREVEHSLPSTSRGLRMKVADYAKYGYAALVSGRLHNQNAAKVREDEQMALLDELLAKHTNLDNAQVATIYNTVANVCNWKTLTAQTVGNRKQENNLVLYAGRNGKNALLDNKLMQNRRMKVSAPMLMWTIDGWDAELLYQKTEMNAKGQNVTTSHNRLTVVVVLDPYNKYPVGYAIGTHETPALIRAAMRNAMQHVKELFGSLYRPYQLQSDNYGKGNLTPMYTACTAHYTPAKVKNAKSKVIEPWFNRFNKEYCQVFDNWSGYNVNSGSLNQPNDEMLNQLKKTFPDEAGCRKQLEAALEADRMKKQAEYVANWANVAEQYKSEMPYQTYLQYLGHSTGYTNRLQPKGLVVTIDGAEHCYDSFDINFRKLAHLDWVVKFDPQDLTQVLVLNAESKNGKLVEVTGTYGFMLTEKYMPAMALADRKEDDGMHLKAVKEHNSSVMDYIADVRGQNAEHVTGLFNQNPQLNDTLAKLVLTDNRGQHKNHKNALRMNKKARELIEAAEVVETTQKEKSWQEQQNEYYNSKINLNEYI